MFRKMLSTIIAALVIFSAFAVMPAMAAIDEVGTEYFRDDFENYVVGTKYDKSAALTDKDGVRKWSNGKGVGSEIVSVKGYDGEDTQAVKVYLLDNSTGSSDGARRFNANPVDYTNNTPTTGIAVAELSVYMPEDYYIKTFNTSTFRRNYAGINYADDGQNIGARVDGGWSKMKLVTNMDTGETITYFNDVMTTYHKYSREDKFPFYAGKTTFNYIQSSEDEFVAGRAYMIVDDVNMYYAPAATAVKATFPANEATGAKLATEPSVTFTHPLMNVITDVKVGEGVEAPTTVVTTDNVTVEVIECADESKLGEVEIEEVTLSNGNKTLEIKPATDLPGAAKVQVTVSGLKDDMDRAIDATSFTFETMEAPNVAGAPVFKKENLMMSDGTVINTLQNGYISCNYELTNNSTTADIDVLYFAVLKVNDVVESFQFMPATIAANGGTAAFYGGFNVKDAENSVIEVCVWDGFQNMASLVPMVTFDAIAD